MFDQLKEVAAPSGPHRRGGILPTEARPVEMEKIVDEHTTYVARVPDELAMSVHRSVIDDVPLSMKVREFVIIFELVVVIILCSIILAKV